VKDSEARIAYVAAHRAEWVNGVNGVATGGRTLADGASGTGGTIQSALTNIDNSLAGLTPGTLENYAVNHRINANGRYRFSEGTLKGLSVVAGVQYRGFGKNGSRDTRLHFNLPESVTPTAAQNAEAAWDYLWTPPSWKSTITAGANYTRRFGKYNWRFQLNVDNVLNNLDPIWGRSGPVGNGASAYTTLASNALNAGNPRMQILTSFVNPDPRKFTLTTTVSF